MPIYETFAKRKRNAEMAGKPVIYRQDELPNPLRVQVAHILDSTIGDHGQSMDHHIFELRRQFWQTVHAILAREMGLFTLSQGVDSIFQRCQQFLLGWPDVDDVLSFIEVAFAMIESGQYFGLGFQTAEDAIGELNIRFREHAIGYQFQGGQIIPVQSQYLHIEAVEPAIQLLHDAQFAGPLQEFMQAHKHYREGNNKEAIVNAQNAFESTMKAICDQRGWDYGTERATASKLVDVLFSHNLIPAEMQSHFTALRSTLESGLPTVRNRGGRGGHGQGSDIVEVPDYLAAYCLHLAATDIVLLIEAHNASK